MVLTFPQANNAPADILSALGPGDVVGALGLDCDPITAVGTGSGAACTAQTVCCTRTQDVRFPAMYWDGLMMVFLGLQSAHRRGLQLCQLELVNGAAHACPQQRKKKQIYC